MKKYNEIAQQIVDESKQGLLKSVSDARKRLEELCKENNQTHNLFSLASTLGIA